MLIKLRKAQSSLEYITLFSVIVAAIIIGQAFLKRRAQGYIKEQGESISNEGWSFSNSQEHYKEVLESDQVITENINTEGNADNFITGEGEGVHDLQSANLYSRVDRTGGETKIQRYRQTDALTQEDYEYDDYDTSAFNDFSLEGSWE